MSRLVVLLAFACLASSHFLTDLSEISDFVPTSTFLSENAADNVEITFVSTPKTRFPWFADLVLVPSLNVREPLELQPFSASENRPSWFSRMKNWFRRKNTNPNRWYIRKNIDIVVPSRKLKYLGQAPCTFDETLACHTISFKQRAVNWKLIENTNAFRGVLVSKWRRRKIGLSSAYIMPSKNLVGSSTSLPYLQVYKDVLAVHAFPNVDRSQDIKTIKPEISTKESLIKFALDENHQMTIEQQKNPHTLLYEIELKLVIDQTQVSFHKFQSFEKIFHVNTEDSFYYLEPFKSFQFFFDNARERESFPTRVVQLAIDNYDMEFWKDLTSAGSNFDNFIREESDFFSERALQSENMVAFSSLAQSFPMKQPLHFLIDSGKIDLFKEFLPKYNNINEADEKTGFTPLMLAVKKNLPEFVQLLLNRQDIEVDKARTNSPKTAMGIAFDQKNKEIAKMIAQHPDLHLRSRDNSESYLKSAIRTRMKDVAYILLQKENVNFERFPNGGGEELLEAVEQKDEAMVATLLERDDISRTYLPEKGKTPFGQACYQGDLKIVQLFLQKLSDKEINMPFSKNNKLPAIFEAARKGHVAVVKLLVEHESFGKLDEVTVKHIIDKSEYSVQDYFHSCNKPVKGFDRFCSRVVNFFKS